MTAFEREIQSTHVPSGRSAAGAQTDEMAPVGALRPLDHELMVRSRARGFGYAAADIGLPIRAVAQRSAGYSSCAYVPAADALPADQARAAHARIAAAAARLRDRWETTQRPAIEQHLAYWRAFHLRGASDAELAAHLGETEWRLDDAWRVFYDAGLPLALALRDFTDLHLALFGDAAHGELATLLGGVDSEQRRTDRALRELADEATAMPYVRDALRWCADHEVIEALLGDLFGREVLRRLRALMADAPGWVEDPLPLIRRLRAYALAAAGASSAEEMAAARQRLEAEVAERLALLPAAADAYGAALASALAAVRLREDRALWIERRALAEVRRVVAEAGRRLVGAGQIARAEGVSFLDIQELRQALAGSRESMRSTVELRRAEFERARDGIAPVGMGRAVALANDVARSLVELAYAAA